MKTHLIVAVAALSIGAGGAVWVQAQRYGLKIERLKHQATSKDLAGERQAVKDMAGFQKGLNDALSTFQATTGKNVAAAQDAERTLRELRTVTGGLRGDFASLPAKIERATTAASAEYITACTAVFADMAAAGERLAEAGAAIAVKADGHAADARLMSDAWPRVRP